MQLRVSLIIVGVSLLLLLIFISRFIKSITTPVMHLVHSAKRIAQGDFSHSFTPLPSMKSEEIMLLTNTFAYMTDTITKQMNALKDKIDLSERLHTLEMQNINIQLSLTEKEMYLMQSMINPHFLFNCLGTVSSMAILENAPRTQDISTRIARCLRRSIDLVGSRIPPI